MQPNMEAPSSSLPLKECTGVLGCSTPQTSVEAKKCFEKGLSRLPCLPGRVMKGPK